MEHALNTDRAVQDQRWAPKTATWIQKSCLHCSYVQKVIESYVANKKKQGESPQETSQKLVYIVQRVSLW